MFERVRDEDPTHRGGRGGFTLVELVITVGLVGIIAAIAIPNIAHFNGRYRLNHATARLESHLQECRTRAIADNREYAVQLLERDENADAGEWRENRGKYRLLRGDRPRGSTTWEPVSIGFGDQEGEIDLHAGPGDVAGVSIESWSDLQGPTYSELPDALVCGAHGHITNASADFQDEYVRIVLRNRAANPRVEQRAVLVDRGGNTLVVVPD